MKLVALSAGLALSVPPLAGVFAQGLSPAPVFEGSTTVYAKNGVTQAIHIKVESWGIAGQGQETRKLPLPGFYIAHLLSGDISTIIDGQLTTYAPGDYWTVRSGAIMQVKVLGEFAVLETIVVTR
jgi:quercetin dioxygenase-like cupin family protein